MEQAVERVERMRQSGDVRLDDFDRGGAVLTVKADFREEEDGKARRGRLVSMGESLMKFKK